MMSGDPQQLANVADCTLSIDDGPAALNVTCLRGAEALSALYQFQAKLCTEELELDLASILGKNAVLTVTGESGPRNISGIVRSAERRGQAASRAYYAVEIVPLHWFLTKRSASRIFQDSNCPDMSVPGVIRKVLADAGIPEFNTRFALQNEYAAREVVVQYRETDMDFISRLMEHEGIFYFFEHSADGHVMVIADGSAAFTTADPGEVPYRDPNGLLHERECVYRLMDRERIVRGAVTLDDYDGKRPATQLRATRKAAEWTALERSDYPGEYVDRSEGERYAQIRLEEEQSSKRLIRIDTSIRGLAPGQRVSLCDHPCAAVNREYVVTGVRHTYVQPQSAEEFAGARANSAYRTRISAIPVQVAFRPARRTPRPRIHGSQTALVVGPPGEEIWTDEYGRIRVQFHWDQEGVYDENSSCWMRVAHGWAGGSYGMLFLPRVGQEVVVSFLEGNPDRPLVTGSVYNNDNMPPCRLPEDKSRSTIKSRSTVGGGGCHEIRFDDAKGAEQLFLHASRDLHVRALNDRVETVVRDSHLIVEQHQYELVKQKKHAEVRLDLIEKVGGGKHLEVAGDVGERFRSNHHEAVAGRYFLKAEDKLVLESATGICLKVGGNFITIDSAGIYVMGTVIHLNSEGAALSAAEVAEQSPAAPLEANTADPGTDVTYAADPGAMDALGDDSGNSSDDQAETAKETTWIEIELVDEAGQAWPNEPYEVIEPDGAVHRGSLDKKGQAHVAVENPGECQISFPKLDRRAWERS